MITPDEIKSQSLKWWKDFLVSSLNNENFFPKEINRIGKVKPGEALSSFSKVKNDIHLLLSQSKDENGFGYIVETIEINNRSVGKQLFPSKIIFEVETDYLKFIDKQKEYSNFKEISQKIIGEIPLLREWVKSNPLRVIEHSESWEGLIKVCKYFLSNPIPNLYIRQLPIEIHTKFISENESILFSLLDFLIPEHLQQHETSFEKRFNLRSTEPLIRIRYLDKSFSPAKTISDVSLPISEFNLQDTLCNNILITENKMNFLTLPPLKGSIAVWSGGGFNVSYLKDADWLKSKNIFYWGDIDTHGYWILNQIRKYFPKTVAILMNRETLEHFFSLKGDGEKTSDYTLERLTTEELEFYRFLKDKNIRLEQEKITQEYAERIIGNIP